MADPPTAKRDPKTGQLLKGSVLNPTGRPKVVAHVRDLARQCTEDAIRTLHEIALNKEEPAAARVTAANSLLDRGYGKPMQVHDVRLPSVDQMSADELKQVFDAEFEVIEKEAERELAEEGLIEDQSGDDRGD